MDIQVLKEELREFARQRDWEQFHTPKNLIMALNGEVGELNEIFQWLTDQQSSDLSDNVKEHASQELADILIYLIRLCDVLGIDPELAISEKIKINSIKYPVSLSKGNAVKYNKRND
jgi:NTP pyrophosphatase (non-canonical NTP hydrolase)